jgi:hypothetical protein
VAEGYAALPNERVSAANGVEYAYRDTGAGAGTGADTGAVPLAELNLPGTCRERASQPPVT